jgi:tetratricopeptide (TPR) repeat protein
MRAQSTPERLDSWKEIADYLGRTVRTVQRWQREGLPVHRHHHKKLGSIFAIPSELDDWCRQRAAAGAALTQRDHYHLLSRHHLRARTVESLQKSAKYAQLAIDRDPAYAPAYAALALAYAVLVSYGGCRPHTLMPQARAAAYRALQLDRNLAEAHCALGLVDLLYTFDWEAAERSFHRAMRVRPGDASIYHWLALQRLVTRRHEEALRLMEEAHARDPLSPMVGALHGWVLLLLQRPNDAITILEATIDLDPLFFRAYPTLAWAYLELGRPHDAGEAIQRAAALNGIPLFQSILAECDARAGDQGAALERMRDIEARGDYNPMYWRARVYTWADQPDRALDLLEESLELREWFVILLGHEPAFEPLRTSSRFRRLLSRIGLPPE